MLGFDKWLEEYVTTYGDAEMYSGMLPPVVIRVLFIQLNH